MFYLLLLFILPALVMADNGDEPEFYEIVPGGLAIASSCVSFIITVYVVVMKRINSNRDVGYSLMNRA